MIKYPVQIDGSGYEEIDGKVGSLVQFDFHPSDREHYGLVMVDGKFHTVSSECVTALPPEEEPSQEEVGGSDSYSG